MHTSRWMRFPVLPMLGCSICFAQVVGFDAGKEAVKAVLEGRISAVVAQNPFNMGKCAVAAAYRAARGESVEKRIDTGTGLVTKDNAADYLK
jgi:ribose transport system substrate-binding protein